MNIWTAGDRNGSDSIISALMDALRPILSFKVLIFFLLTYLSKSFKIEKSSYYIKLLIPSEKRRNSLEGLD